MNKEIKIIDLLNMIAEGKEVPMFKFKKRNSIWKYNPLYFQFQSESSSLCLDIMPVLNEPVEIIEDKKETYYNKDFMPVEEDNKITLQDVEISGYACNKIRKAFEKGWNKCEEDNNKIEKITGIDTRETRQCIIKFQEKFDEIIDKINNME